MGNTFRHAALALAVFLIAATSFAQTSSLSGRVTDKANQTPLPGASIAIRGTTKGTTSRANGTYSISGLLPGRYTIVVTYMGYKTFERTLELAEGENKLDIALEEAVIQTQELVVFGASRRTEKVTDAPASVQTVSSAELDRVPLAAYGYAMSTLKGVDFVRSGIDGIGINARGFNSAFNTRMLVVTDSRFSILPGNGLPIGNLNTNIKEDIASIEMILGPSSALYGPNAHNGVVNVVSKDPRTSQGTMFALNAGLQSYFSGRFRHAGAVGDFAWKATFEYMTARDWEFVDTVYQTPANGGNIPHFNPANPVITRPGFDPRATGRIDTDEDLFLVRHIRGEGTFIWNLPFETAFLGDRPDLILSYGQSNNWGAGPTNAGRNYINNWLFAYWQAKFVSPRLFAQIYNTWNNSGNTFPIQNVTNIMNGNIVPVPTLFGPLRDTNRVNRVLRGTITASEAIQAARFAELSSRLNAEIQYNNQIGDRLRFVLAFNYQVDNPRSDGTYLGDNAAFRGDGSTALGTGRLLPESYISLSGIKQIGGALQLDFNLTEQLRLLGALRYDNHDIFGAMLAPKIGAIYSIGDGALRATYGRGYVAPTVLNMFIFVPAAVVAGSTLSIVGNSEGFTLQNGTVFDKLRPERVDTYEIGYKGVLTGNLFLDISAYFQNSADFISPAVPLYSGFTPDQRVVRIGNTDVQPQFVQTYVNFGQVTAFGVDAGITYNINNNWTIGLNYSWFRPDFDANRRDGNRLVFDVNRDGVVTPNEISINTPEHKASLVVTALNLFDGLLFGSLAVRYVSSYDFVSGVHYAGRFGEGTRTIIPRDPSQPLGPNNPAAATFLFNRGPLGGFVTVDLNIGVNITKELLFSISATNLFNTMQREMVASPAVPRFLLSEVRYTIPAFY
ncbi:MAG: TonB-dependent receptor [Chloroherpetonaceae bacterium]|nr:TonB-dependent receptor [Chloroherpetonaceae bacterium]